MNEKIKWILAGAICALFIAAVYSAVAVEIKNVEATRYQDNWDVWRYYHEENSNVYKCVVSAPPPNKIRYITGVWFEGYGTLSLEIQPGNPPDNKIITMYAENGFWSSGGGAPIKLECGEELWGTFSTPHNEEMYLTITGYDVWECS